MITKADLKRYRSIDAEMKQLERLMQRLRERAEMPRVTVMSDIPRGRSAETDTMAANIAKLDELLRHYNTLWDELIDLQRCIEVAVERLDPTRSRLIRLRYFEGYAWERICVEMGYAWAQTHRLHAEALQKLAA